tara:strand:+ start:1084 stop:2202 length:1119 start_codon:yes stop_codon:yes gene_type:complete
MHYFNSNLEDNPAIVKAEQTWLIDKNGKRFFDCWLGAGSLVFGHENLSISNVSWMLPKNSVLKNDNAHLINKLVDFKVGSIGIQTSGSSAVTRACRVARAITQKRLIALIGNFWHGSDDEFLFRKKYQLLSDGLAIEAGKNYVWFESISSFLEEASFHDYAAILIEPVQGSNPNINTVKDLLDSKIRDKFRKEKILVIFDEIITGFRTHFGSSLNSRECKPDIVIFGKALAGGYPIGLVIVDEQYTEILKMKRIFWGGTFSANPLQIELMYNQLMKLEKVNYTLIKKNLNDICHYIINTIKIEEIGFTIKSGLGFARILEVEQSKKTSRGFLFGKTNLENKLEKLCLSHGIYIPNNRLIFASIFNINTELNL